MQDIARDDLCLLSNGGCDRDLNSASTTTTDSTPALERLKLPRTPDLEPSIIIKLEESPDVTYPWNVSSELGSNLLHHSDDPLLSRATDDRHNEFSPLHKAPPQQTYNISSKQSFSVPCSNSTAAPMCASSAGNGNKKAGGGKSAAPRSRKKGQFKLRFHHQALPQEYLDHYEASQRLANAQTPTTPLSLKFPSILDTPESPQDRTNENIRNWLQKISELQNEGVSMAPTSSIEDCLHLPSSSSCSSSMLIRNSTNVATPATPAKHSSDTQTAKVIKARPPTPSPSISKVVNYNDLPFMGEMTLDNSKPRRGRKPKKADICHLIYKNYGTIFPGTPADLVDTNVALAVKPTTLSAKKGEVQTRISSLLEKRLTVKSGFAGKAGPVKCEVAVKLEEPLNLCLRDTAVNDDLDSLTVSSDDADVDIELNNELAKNLKLVLPNPLILESKSTPTPLLTATSSSSGDAGGVYWPDGNVYVHPMAALYYQKLLEANAAAGGAGRINNPLQVPGQAPNQIIRPAKSDSNAQTPSRPGTASSASSFNSNKPSPASNSNGPPVQKRKRSAIFIPPMPLETTNPATEVSICKFKFTGGAKPSLQEKKMLSVDSGGNFRYYSGTGDKSMRGYEFFPRERLQQSALMAGSSAAGAFLNAHGEKMSIDIGGGGGGGGGGQQQESVSECLPTSLQSIQTPGQSISLANRMFGMMPSPSPSSSSALGFPQTAACPPHLTQFLDSSGQLHQQPAAESLTSNQAATVLDRRKRKSRRSIQREKLEKTFKEKGFLIQTQQTESAGATYCKFRQLKKFTRYLFRSWKNYLPGDLQQQQQQMQIQQQQHLSHDKESKQVPSGP